MTCYSTQPQKITTLNVILNLNLLAIQMYGYIPSIQNTSFAYYAIHILCKAAYITHELLHDYLYKCSTCRVYNIIIRRTVLRIMDVIILHAML